MNSPRLLLSLLLGGLLTPALAEACVCAIPKPVCQEYWETPVVFTGLVLDEYDWESGHDYIVRFQVEEAFRGVNSSEVVLREPLSTCTFPFERGRRYLVFAYYDEVTRNLSASSCGVTVELESAEGQEALQYLRGLPDAKGGGRIFGRVQLDCPGREDCLSLGDVPVRVTAGDRTFKTNSDDSGTYEIPSVPPGKYRVAAELPPPLTSREYKVEILDGSCAELDFNANPYGVIRGRVLDGKGDAVSRAHVGLHGTSPDQSGDEPTDGDQTDDDGEFELLAPSAGRYVLGVNIFMLPDLQSPYPTTYYPGVSERKDAVVLELGEGQVLSNVEIRVPVRLPEVRIEVEVRWPDGRPATDAAVAVWPRDETHTWAWPTRPTDQEGRVVVTLLEGERYRIGAGAALPDGGGWACARAFPLDTSKPTEPLTFVLDEEVVVWPLEGRCEEKPPRW